MRVRATPSAASIRRPAPARRVTGSFENILPQQGVYRPGGKTGDLIAIDGDEHEARLEKRIGRGIDVPHQPGVFIQM
jgi:hypothetical protein